MKEIKRFQVWCGWCVCVYFSDLRVGHKLFDACSNYCEETQLKKTPYNVNCDIYQFWFFGLFAVLCIVRFQSSISFVLASGLLKKLLT